MYSNIGKKIKILTIIIFVLKCLIFLAVGFLLLMLPSIITGIIEGIEFVDYYGEVFTLKDVDWYTKSDIPGLLHNTCLIIAIAIWVCGILSALVSSFKLYGYGELIDKTAENAKNTGMMLEMMKNGAAQMPVAPMSAPVPQTSYVPQPPVYPTPAPTYEPGMMNGGFEVPMTSGFDPEPQASGAGISSGEKECICPDCGEVNRGGSVFCIKCGAKLL